MPSEAVYTVHVLDCNMHQYLPLMPALLGTLLPAKCHLATLLLQGHAHVGSMATSVQDRFETVFVTLCTDAPSVTPLRDTVQAHGGDLGVELHCEVKGDPTPEIQWLWEGVELTEFSHVRLPENGSVVIALMIPALAGQYVCTASSFVGSASATIHLEYAGM